MPRRALGSGARARTGYNLYNLYNLYKGYNLYNLYNLDNQPAKMAACQTGSRTPLHFQSLSCQGFAPFRPALHLFSYPCGEKGR